MSRHVPGGGSFVSRSKARSCCVVQLSSALLTSRQQSAAAGSKVLPVMLCLPPSAGIEGAGHVCISHQFVLFIEHATVGGAEDMRFSLNVVGSAEFERGGFRTVQAV